MYKRIVKSIGIATVVAAAAVPSALAVHPAQEFAGTVGTLSASAPAAYEGYKSSYPQLHAVATSVPTSIPYLSHGVDVDASQFGGTGVEQTSLRPDDRAGLRTTEPSPIVSVASTGNGFNWGDAGAGAGGAIGLFLLLGLTAMASRKGKDPLAA